MLLFGVEMGDMIPGGLPQLRLLSGILWPLPPACIPQQHSPYKDPSWRLSRYHLLLAPLPLNPGGSQLRYRLRGFCLASKLANSGYVLGTRAEPRVLWLPGGRYRVIAPFLWELGGAPRYPHGEYSSQ